MEETNSKNLSKDLLSQEIILEYQEYYLPFYNSTFKIILIKNQNEIIIKCKNYMISFNELDISLLTKSNFDTLDSAYEYLYDLFEDYNVKIDDILIKKEIKLLFSKNTEIVLTYDKENKDKFIENINYLRKEIINLKNENKSLNNQINRLKNKNIDNDPKKIELSKEITTDSYAYTDLVNSFTVFKSIDEILYLIYATRNKSIICYDLQGERNIKEIENAHNEYITNLSHYFDKINRRDLVMSISLKDNNINIWNSSNNWECILKMPNIYENGYLYSACFLNENNQDYIITSNYNSNINIEPEPIIVFDFNKQKIKEIDDSREKTLFIDTYYDNILNKNYIITGNSDSVISYDYNINEVYHKYREYGIRGHPEIIVKNVNDIIKLIESSGDGNLRIWNFHSGELLTCINVCEKNSLNGICLWNDDYLFVGSNDHTIKLVELNNGLIVKNLSGHNDDVVGIKKINHPQFGECLISQGWESDQIKIWLIKNN